MAHTYIPQIFVNAHGDYGYNVVEFTDNLTTERHNHILDITAYMDEKYNGQEIWFVFDNDDNTSHHVHGTWNNGEMTNILTDEIIVDPGNSHQVTATC